MTVQFKEETYGKTAQNLTELANNLTAIDWFSNIGKIDSAMESLTQELMENLGVRQYEIKWATSETVPSTIGKLTFENSDVWEVLKHVPDQFKEQIDASGQNGLLDMMVDTIPEAVFHPSYAGAFLQFDNQKTISYLVGNAMYLSVLICTAQIAEQPELLKPILEIVESGHTVLGLDGNTIYLV